MAKEYLDLPLEKKHKLSINYDLFAYIKDEIEEFLSEENFMFTRQFAKKVMFSHEVKSNNMVEGITDDLMLIREVIKDAEQIKDENQRKRIINLYKAYQYILTHRVIDPIHLKELYGILSDGLLKPSDLSRMGTFYREGAVYILKSGRIDIEPDEGLSYDKVPKYMDDYFNFVKSESSKLYTSTEDFIVSQIMHFYFVYIHPYFDVNGRTSRTLSMWYLLNKKAYPFIIFNRAINFDQAYYDKAIIDTKKFADVTFFVRYMMENVKKELEKEYLMHQIRGEISAKLTSIDYQSLIYFLSMNGEINVLNFANMYNRFNDKKSVKSIYEEMILPLKEKGILLVSRVTTRNMFGDFPNEVLTINPAKVDKKDPKIKRLNMENK